MAYDLSDYVDVSERITEFREKHPEGSFQVKVVELPAPWDQQFIAVEARAYRTPDDKRPGIDIAWEPVPGKSPYTKDSELMNCSTSAVGRAIVYALAADTKRGIASREEVMNRRDADGGGGNKGIEPPEPPAAAVSTNGERVGFVVKPDGKSPQKAFFDRLLKKGGLTSDQVEAVNRYAEQLPTDRVSKAIDGLNDDDGRTVDATLEALVVEADKFAKAQSDVPYDETA
jgi:hypothetical protein